MFILQFNIPLFHHLVSEEQVTEALNGAKDKLAGIFDEITDYRAIIESCFPDQDIRAILNPVRNQVNNALKEALRACEILGKIWKVISLIEIWLIIIVKDYMDYSVMLLRKAMFLLILYRKTIIWPFEHYIFIIIM